MSKKIIVAAHKRSLWQGNVFKPVSQTFSSQGTGEQNESPSPPDADSSPPEIHEILRDTVNKRAVRILLECILVVNDFDGQKFINTPGPAYNQFG